MGRPPINDPLSTPLRELPVNKQTGLKDQLPSILNQLGNPFSKGEISMNVLPNYCIHCTGK